MELYCNKVFMIAVIKQGEALDNVEYARHRKESLTGNSGRTDTQSYS